MSFPLPGTQVSLDWISGAIHFNNFQKWDPFLFSLIDGSLMPIPRLSLGAMKTF
jgi:hypothetical protein